MPFTDPKRVQYADELREELAHVEAGAEDIAPPEPKRPALIPTPPPPVIPIP